MARRPRSGRGSPARRRCCAPPTSWTPSATSGTTPTSPGTCAATTRRCSTSPLSGGRSCATRIPGFDLWFYWNRYLDPTSEDVNPAVHYLVEGRHRGYATLPEVTVQTPPESPAPGVRMRRVCLFAGFDARRHHRRHGGRLPPRPEPLRRCLLPGRLHARGRRAGQAGAVHARAAGRSATAATTSAPTRCWRETWSAGTSSSSTTNWYWPTTAAISCSPSTGSSPPWIAQASGLVGAAGDVREFTTRDYERQGGPLGLDRVEDLMRQLDLWRYSDFIHVGSYFLVYRQRVIRDPEFRRRLDSVAEQTNKIAIILKYEIGLSRYLILGGYQLATFVDGILPYHPVYRDTAFDPAGRRLPAAQAAVPLREPVLRTRPREMEGAGAGGRP